MEILHTRYLHNSGKLLAKTKAGNYIVRVTKGVILYDYKRFTKKIDAKKFYSSISL